MTHNKYLAPVLFVIAALLLAVIITVIVESRIGTSTSTGTSATSTDSTPATQVNKSYTLAEVAQHGTGESCWTAISGGVYDLTAWIMQHPGGAQAILSICGKDGTAAFTGQHGGRPEIVNGLTYFKIGMLK